jgi:hypothetical protein
MEMVVSGSHANFILWDHFLLRDIVLSLSYSDGSSTWSDTMTRIGADYRWQIPQGTQTIELTIAVVFRYSGKQYPLLKLWQRFQVVYQGATAIAVLPIAWQRLGPNQVAGTTIISPPSHPLLSATLGTVRVGLEFLDITELFTDIHGDTPWFTALEIVKSTTRTILILAALRGQPLLWCVVIPPSVANDSVIRPVVLYLPGDFGGLSYDATSVQGIAARGHDTSYVIHHHNPDWDEYYQCTGEILFDFLTNPISDSDYDAKLDAYLKMTEKFKKRQGINPPPLHHFRDALTYDGSSGTLRPLYWDVPFGFEQAISDSHCVLVIPLVSNGITDFAVQAGLKSLITSAILLIYVQNSTFNADASQFYVDTLTLTCYSQSGGYLFAAVSNNASDLKAIICFEPEYMNGYKKKEDTRLPLGKDEKVIPKLLKLGAKVVLVGRRTQGKDAKYLPEGVDKANLILLPDDAHYDILKYPSDSATYDPNASPVLARRYSRLLHNLSDRVIDEILSSASGPVDLASANAEGKVEEIIRSYRQKGYDDEKMVKAVFVARYNIDDSGGYYTHDFIISCGQELSGNGQSILRFLSQALGLIG